MSISTLPTPLSAFSESEIYTGPVLIMAWEHDPELTLTDKDDTWALCTEDEGRMVVLPISALRIDVRYDWNTHKWVDVNGVTEPDDSEDDAPHGRPKVP